MSSVGRSEVNLWKFPRSISSMLIMNDNFTSVCLCPFPAENTWYGTVEQRFFWDYIRVACRRIKNSCVANIDAFEWPETSLGKVYNFYI